MPNAQELLSMLYEMRNDLAMRDFWPVINEMINGIKVPDYDNTERVIDLFTQNDLQFHCNQLAKALHFRSTMGMHKPNGTNWMINLFLC